MNHSLPQFDVVFLVAKERESANAHIAVLHRLLVELLCSRIASGLQNRVVDIEHEQQPSLAEQILHVVISEILGSLKGQGRKKIPTMRRWAGKWRSSANITYPFRKEQCLVPSTSGKGLVSFVSLLKMTPEMNLLVKTAISQTIKGNAYAITSFPQAVHRPWYSSS